MGKKGLALEEAPVFYPTEDEFQNALRYIAAIREQAEPYGLCRIVPPASWQPPFALPEDWRFPTKVQKVHHLQERQGGFDSHTWRMEYERFLRKTGRPLARWPLYAGEELDLCKLYNAVKRHGSLEGVTADRKWPAIARLMRRDGASEQSPNAGAILRQLYQKHLLAYETWERDPARHAHLGEDSSTDDEGQGMKQAPRKVKGRGSEQLGATEMDVAAAFLELGTAKVSQGEGGRTGRGLAAADDVETRQDQRCQACEGPGHEDKMILCDRCDSGWHIHCLSPPLPAVPPGNWYCPRCVTSEDAFGFGEGTEFTLEEFQKYANRFKRKWFGAERVKSVLPDDIEAEFWRTVEQSKQPVEVLYGSDLDASIYGSGFPRAGHARGTVAAGEWEAYARSSWNLNNMPRDDASVLNRIDDQIPGVMVPWVYIGMMFSSFCWHYEDHCLYSINYCHWCAPTAARARAKLNFTHVSLPVPP